MTECVHCIAAIADPKHGQGDKGCRDCLARDIARSPEAWASRRQGLMTVGLKQLIRRVFGENWKEWAPRVKFWGEHCK